MRAQMQNRWEREPKPLRAYTGQLFGEPQFSIRSAKQLRIKAVYGSWLDDIIREFHYLKKLFARVLVEADGCPSCPRRFDSDPHAPNL